MGAVFIQSFITVLRNIHWIKGSNTNQCRRQIYITSSIAGLVGSPGQSVYSASKHAINGFVKSLRYELVRDNIQMGLVCPGPFRPSENSNDGMGETKNGSSGRLLKKDAMKKKMTAERAAELYVTAIACGINEAWLTYSHILLFAYICQYLPCLESVLVKVIGPRRMK